MTAPRHLLPGSRQRHRADDIRARSLAKEEPDVVDDVLRNHRHLQRPVDQEEPGPDGVR